MQYKSQLQDWTFRQIHHNSLIYNTCWEDPRCDRQLMDFDADSEVVMITSAGCNALAYLLDNPAAIHCIDMNPRQNALLELKQASIEHGDFEAHSQLFLEGRMVKIQKYYDRHLRQHLSESARQVWDKNIFWFSGRGVRKRFYYHGTSGTLAWMMMGYLRTRVGFYKQLKQLFNAETLEAQRHLYDKLEPRVLNQFVQWAVNRHFTMCLIGVPRSQQELLRTDYQEGAAGFLKATLRRVFTTTLISENYFWQVYFRGHYPKNCKPDYLVEGNFPILRERVRRIKTYTTTFSNFLHQNPGKYSHFILLDHQDWLADNDVAALHEEWHAILANSRPGTKILMRTAAKEINFFPDFVLDQVDFVPQEELAPIHAADRVGSYAAVYLGIVK